MDPVYVKRTWENRQYGDIFYDSQGNTLQIQRNLDTGELFAAVVQWAAKPFKLATGKPTPRISGKSVNIIGRW